MSRAPHVPTPETIATVKRLSSMGVDQEYIGLIIGVSHVTLRKHYRHVLDVSAIQANANVAGALYGAAMNGSVAAQMFWLKTRAGWRDVNRIESVGADGGPIAVDTTFRVEFVRPQKDD